VSAASRSLLPAIAGLVLLARSSGAANWPQLSRTDATQLLDAYDQGRYDAVEFVLAATDRFDEVSQSLRRRGPPWIAAGASPEQRDRRRLIAATVALETAKAGVERAWSQVRDLMEWGCGLLRSTTTPVAGKTYWYLESVALAERAHDYWMLFGGSADVPSPASIDSVRLMPSAAPTGWLHMAHARIVLRDNPRLSLAEIILREPLAGAPARDVPQQTDGALRQDAQHMDTPGAEARSELQRRAVLGRIVEDCEQLISAEPDLRAECHVRMGRCWLELGDPNAALEHLRRVDAPGTDPFLTYLAHFLAAQALEAENDRSLALTEYQRALAAWPGAQSGMMRLAALQFFAHHWSEADALVDGALSVSVDDPWREYAYGDFRYWSVWMRRLRGSLAP
jgi:hypothetical protein